MTEHTKSKKIPKKITAVCIEEYKHERRSLKKTLVIGMSMVQLGMVGDVYAQQSDVPLAPIINLLLDDDSSNDDSPNDEGNEGNEALLDDQGDEGNESTPNDEGDEGNEPTPNDEGDEGDEGNEIVSHTTSGGSTLNQSKI